jgi:tetratricopeptide (TPR) repeat protein
LVNITNSFKTKVLNYEINWSIISPMKVLRELLFEKGLVSEVLQALHYPQSPGPEMDPHRTLLYSHALSFYGDYQQALETASAIPPGPSYEAERLWGLANASLGLGDLEQARAYLEEAFEKNPSDWLLPQLFNARARLYVFQGSFEHALSAIEKGIAVSQRSGRLIEQGMLEGVRGIVKLYQGNYEGAIVQLERSAKQLLDRDSLLYAARYLINLSSAYRAVGATIEERRCQSRAEGLIEKSGSMDLIIHLKYVQGGHWLAEGSLNNAVREYETALEILRKYPRPTLEVSISCNLAAIYFEKGDHDAALGLVRKTLVMVREKGLRTYEIICLAYEGKFLLDVGQSEEAIALLSQARALSESLGTWSVYYSIALYLSLGFAELKERMQALQWLRKGLEVAERCQTLSQLLTERDLLTQLLLKFGEELSPTGFLSKLIIQLRHPVLVKRLLRYSPEAKVLFLRSLKIRDARHYRHLLDRLRKDPAKEVRRSARLILKGWHQHAGFKVYTFGTFRVFLEGTMLTEKDWIRPGVRRLFFYFLARPEEWHPTEALIEALQRRPDPRRARTVLKKLFSYLRSVFEPWHLPGMDYAFFQSRRGAYGFFPGERFWMDYQEFERGVKKAEKAHRDRNFKEARKAYREALDLYLGDYLEEFPYEDWLRPKRDYLRELYFRGVLRYASLEKESGNLPEARRVLEEALFKDLSRCDCITLLIQTLAQMKLTQQAKDWGQRHIQYMKKELKEKPAPEVMEALGKLG